jgi:hypothetical protein
MKSVVVYESIYGNTAHVAEAIAAGLREYGDVVLLPAGEEVRDALTDADLLVLGGPTHIHGMSSSLSRRGALDDARKKGTEDALHVEGDVIRGFLHGIGEGDGMRAAAFDTRLDKPRVLTGSAAKGIAKQLRQHDFHLIGEPESFLVEDTAGPVSPGELDRASAWGRSLGRATAPSSP